MFQVAFLLAVLLPYVALPFLRFPAETQPWAAILGWLFVAVRAVSARNLKVSSFDLILVALTTIIMVYVYHGQPIDLLYYVKKNAAFLFSISIIFFGRRVTPRALWIALVVAVTIYVFFGVLQVVANPLYQTIGTIFVPLRQVSLLKRGVASLCAEATDFGFLSVYLLFFTLMLMRIENPPTSIRNLRIVAVAAGLCVVASTSGSGLIALAAVLGIIFLPRIWNARTVLLGVVVVATVLPLLILAPPTALLDIRGIHLLSLLVTSPDVLVASTTFSYRFISNFISLIALFQSYGLGYGAGAFTHIAPQIYVTHGLGSVWQLESHYFTNVRNVLETNPVGVFPLLLLEDGLIGVALIVHLWRAVYRSAAPYRWAALVLMTLAWAQSFPVAWPPFWLLIGLSLNAQFRDAWSRQPRTRRRAPLAGAPPLLVSREQGHSAHRAAVMPPALRREDDEA